MKQVPSAVTIDIDTGGTFTDGFISGSGVAIQVKVDTTPHDLTLGIIACIDRAAEMLEVDRRQLLSAATAIRLSTTVGTNALINRTGPNLGVLVGPELHARPGILDGLPLRADLVAVTDGVGDESVLAVKQLLERGARLIVIALDGDGGSGVEEAETALRRLIALEYPRHYLGAVPVLSSHEVTRSPDPVARLRTAVVDAYLHPMMSRFLYRVEDELRREGYRHPLLIGNADGGSSRVAKTSAVRTWGSGPAGAVAGAAHLARSLDIPELLTLDVGGTSSDIALISNGAWRYAVEPEMAGISVAVPVLELESLGVGGGSLVRVVDGELLVGPTSAGAQPGPAAFGLGGEDATLTDAFCCLGVFDPAHFLGGRKKLDVAASEQVFKGVADELGMGVPSAARLAIEVAAKTVAAGIRQQFSTYGVDPAEVQLLCGGGGGGLLGAWVADAAGMKAARAFPLAPAFSAYGLSTLDRMHSYEVSADTTGLAQRIETALERARSDMRSEGIASSDIHFELEVEVGAHGMAQAITLGAIADGAQAEALVSARPDLIRLVRVRAVASTDTTPPSAPASPDATSTYRTIQWSEADPTGTQTSVTPWGSVRPDMRHAGPHLIESEDTTVVIPPGFTAVVGEYADLFIPTSTSGA